MERLSKQIAAQRQSIDKLERDEKRLATLIDQLSRVLAEQARRDAEREAARKAREARPRDGPRSRPAPTPPPSRTPPAQAGRRAARRTASSPSCADACRCPWLARSTGRFGAPRKVEGAGHGPDVEGDLHPRRRRHRGARRRRRAGRICRLAARVRQPDGDRPRRGLPVRLRKQRKPVTERRRPGRCRRRCGRRRATRVASSRRAYTLNSVFKGALLIRSNGLPRASVACWGFPYFRFPGVAWQARLAVLR